MADVHGAAEEMRTMITQWMDANDLDQTLEDLHEFPRALQEGLGQYAQKLSEDTNLSERIAEAVQEAAGAMGGIADALQEAIAFGVQRN